MVDFDQDVLRKQIYDIWMKDPKKTQEQIIKEIGISPYVFRRFMDGKTDRFTRGTRVKVLGFVNKSILKEKDAV